MKKDLTELVFILDRSGSMGHLTNDTIGGYNSMVEKQRKEAGEARITTVLFDDEYEVLHDAVDIREVKPLTSEEYFARGCTALLDAVGKTVNAVGERLSTTREEERPSQVIVVITTDGYENASREFTYAKVRQMIEHQTRKYSWKFMFLGANIDAAKEAEHLGISRKCAAKYDYSRTGTKAVYDCVDNAISEMRMCCSMERPYKGAALSECYAASMRKLSKPKAKDGNA